MIIGVVKEIKDNEYRVGMVPAGVKALTESRHQVLVQEGAGEGSGISNEEYRQAGASLVSRQDVWGRSEMVVKVKEPVGDEYGLLREHQILFTYLPIFFILIIFIQLPSGSTC